MVAARNDRFVSVAVNVFAALVLGGGILGLILGGSGQLEQTNTVLLGPDPPPPDDARCGDDCEGGEEGEDKEGDDERGEGKNRREKQRRD